MVTAPPPPVDRSVAPPRRGSAGGLGPTALVGLGAIAVGLAAITLTAMTWAYEVVAIFGLEAVDTPERRRDLDVAAILTAALHGVGILALIVGSIASTIAAPRLSPRGLATLAWALLFAEIGAWIAITRMYAQLQWPWGVPAWFTALAVAVFGSTAATGLAGVVRTIAAARRRRLSR